MQMMSDNIQDIAKALCEAQGKIKNVAKENSSYNYKYADLGQCLNAIREPLKEQGLALTQIIENSEGGSALVTLLMHSSGQWIKSCFPLNPASITMSNKMHAFGSIISYARRYSLAAIVGLAQEDDDAQDSSKEDALDSPKGRPPVNKPILKVAQKKPEPLINQLRELCQNKGIDLKEFGNYFKLVSTDLERMARVVSNFHDYYREYNEREIHA